MNAPGPPIGRTNAHLMGTGDDPGESASGLALFLGNRIEDTGVIRAKIDEAVCDSGLAPWLG